MPIRLVNIDAFMVTSSSICTGSPTVGSGLMTCVQTVGESTRETLECRGAALRAGVTLARLGFSPQVLPATP